MFVRVGKKNGVLGRDVFKLVIRVIFGILDFCEVEDRCLFFICFVVWIEGGFLGRFYFSENLGKISFLCRVSFTGMWFIYLYRVLYL